MGSHKKILLIDKVRLYLLCLVGETVVVVGHYQIREATISEMTGEKIFPEMKMEFP